MSQIQLPSWRRGDTRESIVAFLDEAEMLPVEQRIAVFDLDGTLWSERPQSVLLEFLIGELRVASEHRPELAKRPEYRAALEWDVAAIGRLGAVNVLLALGELHAGVTPEDYEARGLAFFETARHAERGVPYSQTRYRPMLELIAELRARHFSVHLAMSAGVELIRTISERYFSVRPAGVVGAQVGYELVTEHGRPQLVRTRELVGDPNRGAALVESVQRQLGRRPIFAAGNSAGDAEMLDYALAFDGPSLALQLEHDDAERATVYDSGVGEGGWTAVSMRDDWEVIFADS